jgi:hypothetical protein
MRSLLPLLLLLGCAPPPTANPDFSDSARFLFRAFEGDEADLAFALRALQTELDGQIDLDAPASIDRSLAPGPLTEDDVAGMHRPVGDPSGGLTMTVARRSDFAPPEHVDIQLLVDHTPVEPNSPSRYLRTFLDGTEDCWPDRSCSTLRTSNEVIKENLLLEIPYSMDKDLRWVDLGLPDPSSVPAGQPVVNEGEPRWALLGRAWVLDVSVCNAGANTLHHQYSVEAWLPDGDTALRTMSLWWWVEGDGLDEDTQILTARNGIDAIFRRGDEWLADR